MTMTNTFREHLQMISSTFFIIFARSPLARPPPIPISWAPSRIAALVTTKTPVWTRLLSDLRPSFSANSPAAQSTPESTGISTPKMLDKTCCALDPSSSTERLSIKLAQKTSDFIATPSVVMGKFSLTIPRRGVGGFSVSWGRWDDFPVDAHDKPSQFSTLNWLAG